MVSEESLDLEDDALADSEELIHEVRLVADRGQAPMRLDRFVMDRVAKASRTRIQNAIKAGAVAVNGKLTKAAYQVRPADIVTLALPAEPRGVSEIVPEDLPLDIRYEDEALLLVNKPAGLVVHPAQGNWQGTLVNGLAWHLRDLPTGRNGPIRPGLVHRIDKDTSGLLVIGKTEWAMTHLSNQFFHHTIERTYYALVWGVPKEARGTVRGHIGRDPRERKRMIVFPDGEAGKHAVTHYEVVRSFHYAALLKCNLETGRTHQIRAHLRHLGHPLFGDLMYGGAHLLCGPRTARYRQFVANTLAIIPRQALHAQSLGFEHPDTGKRIQLETEFPADFQLALARWGQFADAQDGGRPDDYPAELPAMPPAG